MKQLEEILGRNISKPWTQGTTTQITEVPEDGLRKVDRKVLEEIVPRCDRKYKTTDSGNSWAPNWKKKTGRKPHQSTS
jgi:hypothetical protein